jgi:hypothetical protein
MMKTITTNITTTKVVVSCGRTPRRAMTAKNDAANGIISHVGATPSNRLCHRVWQQEDSYGLASKKTERHNRTE